MRPIHFRRTRRIRDLLLAMGAAHCGLYGQSAGPSELRFDVASVRQNQAAACQGRWDFNDSHGAVIAENAPLRRIVSRAFSLTDDRVSGPAWLDSECYDIRAKVSNDASHGDLMRMLQSLLRTRFHLVAHAESAERPIFALLVDKGGVKIPSYGDHVPVKPRNADGSILIMVRHMPDLCENIGKALGRPVIDETGLNGDYYIVLTYLPFGATSHDPSDSAPDILSAVRDQLGLRLESQRGVVEILKVDSIDRIPTEN